MNKLVYIVGFPRSGSTIIQNVLNEIDQCAAVGEMKTIIGYNLIRGKSCCCGHSLELCEFWGQTISEVVNRYSLSELAEFESRRKVISNRNFSKLLKRGINESGLEKYAEFIRYLYAEVFSTSGAPVIIDSSKDPAYGWFLKEVLNEKVLFLHLVRDPKAAYHSHYRDKVKTNFLRWDLMNRNSEYFMSDGNDSYLRLKYEDFVDSPELTVNSILNFIGVDAKSPIFDERKVVLSVNHTLAGNPNRFKTGEIIINNHRSSASKNSTWNNFFINVFNHKRMRRYGYK